MLITQRGVTFFTDTYVTVDPCAEEIAEMTILAAREIERFGIQPKAALLSHSNFGSRDSASALKMRDATAILHKIAPQLEVDGEMHADSALDERLRGRVYAHSTLSGEANLHGLSEPRRRKHHAECGEVDDRWAACRTDPAWRRAARPYSDTVRDISRRGQHDRYRRGRGGATNGAAAGGNNRLIKSRRLNRRSLSMSAIRFGD
jgi:hypothetical protein